MKNKFIIFIVSTVLGISLFFLICNPFITPENDNLIISLYKSPGTSVSFTWKTAIWDFDLWSRIKCKIFYYLYDNIDVQVIKARDVNFSDIDSDKNEIAGDLIINKAEDESSITHYVLYWGRKAKIVLVGDSIRMGYERFVTDNFNLHEVISYKNLNQYPSGNILINLDKWVIKHNPDIVHINAGLHEVGGKYIIPYEKNLKSIFNKIQSKTSAKIIWATTTPVNQNIRTISNFNNMIKDLNAKALEVINSFKGIVINDLHAYVLSFGTPQRFQDGLHFGGFSINLGHETGRVILSVIPEKIERIATIVKTGSNLSYTIPNNTRIPVKATHILIFTKDEYGESEKAISLKIVDK